MAIFPGHYSESGATGHRASQGASFSKAGEQTMYGNSEIVKWLEGA
jgi:hypothetical protein